MQGHHLKKQRWAQGIENYDTIIIYDKLYSKDASCKHQSKERSYQHPYSYQLMETSEQRVTQWQRGTVHYGERPGHQEDIAVTDVYAHSHSVA